MVGLHWKLLRLEMIRQALSRFLFKLGYWINKAQLINNAKEGALGQYLSSWPEDLSYDSVIYYLRTGAKTSEDKPISIWEPFEDHDVTYVAELIQEEFNSRLRSLRRGLI